MDKLARLNTLYHYEEWKLFEDDIKTHLDKCINELLNDTTPTERAERLRMEAHAYQSLLDKVEVDKKSFIERNKR